MGTFGGDVQGTLGKLKSTREETLHFAIRIRLNSVADRCKSIREGTLSLEETLYFAILIENT